MLIFKIPVNMKLQLNNTVLMIASLIISVLTGFLFRFAGVGFKVNTLLFATGMAYLKLLFLLAVPLVCLSLVTGVMLRLRMRSDGLASARLQAFHCIALVGAVILGMVAGYIAGPSTIRFIFYKGYATAGFNLFRQVAPAVLLLSALAGAAAGKIGQEGKEARRLFRSLADVFGYAGTLLLRFLPVGLFCLLCPLVSMRGLSALWPGVKLALVSAFCCIAYGVLVYGYQLRHCGKDCPRHFLRNFKPVLLQAFTACSSGSGEADALRSLQRMGITEDVGLPAWRCGTLLGKAGTVLYWGIACLMVTRYAGMPVSLLSGLGIFIWIIFMSLASTKYRGSGLYCALMLLCLLGTPLQAAAIPLLLFEWLLDGLRSGLNSAAVGTGAYLADKLGWMK